MSSYEAKDQRARSQQLKVQELAISSDDNGLFVVDGADLVIKVGEEVKKVFLAMQKDDSANSLVHFNSAALSIVDSSSYAAGGDKKAIKIAVCSLDQDDVLIVKYETKQ